MGVTTAWPEPPPAPWYSHSYAPELHPVHEQVWLRWQRNTDRVMAGPLASPLFRDQAAQLDALWRIRGWEGGTPAADVVDPQRVVDLALSGATMGLTLTVQETLARSPEIETASRIVRTFTGPSLRLSRPPGEGDRVRFELNEGARNGRAELARIQQQGPTGGRRPPRPGVSVGQGLRIVERVSEDGARSYSPGLVTYAEVQRVWAEAWRLQDALVADDQGRLIHSWTSSARWRLSPTWTTNVDLSGEGRLPYPDRARFGLGWASTSRPTWLVQPGVVRRFERPDRDRPGEWRADLRLLCNLRWRLPSSVDQWALDKELDSTGRTLPEVPDREPMTPLDPLRNNLARSVEDPLD